MPNREEWGVVNYGQRGRRGYPGVSVKHMDMDSEGRIWSHYSDGKDELVGQAMQGIQGEPGLNGRVVDVVINGQPMVDSEGMVAFNIPDQLMAGENIIIDSEGYINAIIPEAKEYTAGDNIEISSEGEISAIIPEPPMPKEYFAGENVEISSEGIISAVDTTYEAGENISISEGVINAIIPEVPQLVAGDHIVISEGIISANIDDLLGEELTVTRDCGGYSVGDVVPANEKLIDIIKHMLGKALPPQPVREDKLWAGVSNTIPTNIDPAWGFELINCDELLEEGRFVRYFNANRQWEAIAYPATMPDLVKIDQGMGQQINAWTKLDVVYEGVPYKLYYGTDMVKESSSYEFSWRE